MISPNCFNWIILIVANTFSSQMLSMANFPPSFLIQPPKGEYLYRSDSMISLPCFVKAIPSANYEWLKNGRPIENLVVNQNDGSLRVDRANKENEGSYQCVGYNSLGRTISHTCDLKMAYISSYSTFGERTIEVYLGGSVILECDQPACYPSPSIQWVNVKEGVKIISFEEDYRRVLDDKGNLHITRIIKEDDGEVYSCISTNNFLRTMKRGADTKIRIKTHPLSSSTSKNLITLYKSRTDNIVLLNSTLTLSCIFSRGGVKWFKYKPRKEELQIDSRIKIVRKGATLKIVNVIDTDSGKYSCHPENDLSKLFVMFSVQVVEKPSFIEKPMDVTVALDGSHIFKCLATGYPKPKIRWTWNGQDINQYLDGNRIQLFSNELHLKRLTSKDIATLQCNASNSYGYVFTNAYINVWSSKPLFLQAPQKYMKGVLKKNIIIVCNAFSVPFPRIDWRKDSYKLNVDLSSKYKVDKGGNLLIKNLNSQDAGVYECTATNMYGKSKRESTVVIRESTTVISASENKTQLIGTDVLMECSAKTDRLEGRNLIIEWWKNSERLKLSRSPSASLLNSAMKVDSLSPKDSGIYYCNASNGLDWDVRQISLVVEGKPDPAQDLQVDCQKHSEKRIALLSWVEGFNNNADITSHIIEFKTQYDHETWFEVAGLNDTDYEISNRYSSKDRNIALIRIHPNLDYNFRVRSINRLGISDPSEMTVSRCQLTMQRPNVNPSIVFIYGSMPNTLKILWKPVSYLEHNGPNMTYIITIQCTNCETLSPEYTFQISVPSWKTDYITIGNLSNDVKFSQIEIYKRYGVKIQSKNIIGLSTTLPKQHFGFSGESYPTNVPSKAVILEITDHSVRLQWPVIHMSQTSEVNGFFRGYRIEWCLNETTQELCEKKKRFQDEVLFKPNEKELQYRSGELSNLSQERRKRNILSSSGIYDQLYTATLGSLPGMMSIQIWTRIINMQYAGPKSAELILQTKEGTPSAVAEFNVETVEINYIEIAWAKPLITNGILIGYDISVKEIFPDGKGGNIVTTQKIKDPDQLRERISNLKSETRYQVYIWSLTKQGRGKEKYLTVQTRAESKESNLIQLKIERMNKNSFNMSLSFTESIQKQLEIPDSGWKFYLQFRLMKKMMWEETEKQYHFWWRIVGNLISDETYLVRAVVNTKTGSVVTQSRLLKTGLSENNAFYVLRGSSTTWFIILLILIFGLLCGVIGLFIWRRNKVLYMRGKPAVMVSVNQQYQHHLPSPAQDRYTSFVTYSAPENKIITDDKQTIENDFFADKYPYFMQNVGSNVDHTSPKFYPENSNCSSLLRYSMNSPHPPLTSCNLSPSINRFSLNNHIPATWTMPKTRSQALDNKFINQTNLPEQEKVFYQPYDYNASQNPVSTTFV